MKSAKAAKILQLLDPTRDGSSVEKAVMILADSEVEGVGTKRMNGFLSITVLRVKLGIRCIKPCMRRTEGNTIACTSS